MTEGAVAIVGSGIVGSALAYLLTQKGHEVEVFERGPEYPYPHEPQFREEVFYLYQNPKYLAPKDLKNLVVSGEYIHDLNEDFYMVVGGSGTIWAGVTLRMIPSDFKTKTLYGYGDDWPLTYDDLEPYYCKAEAFMGVSGTDDDNPFAPPRSKPFPLPPFELSYDDARFAEKLRANGIVMHTTPQARTRKNYGDRLACDNYGPCWVCPTGSRYSPNYHLQKALETGRCKLRTDVTVRRILTDSSGRASGLVYQHKDERQPQEYDAKVVLVAANAIQSARLLMLSANERYPDGLGNQSGQLGQNLTFHHGWVNRLQYKETLSPGRFGGWTGQSYQFLDPENRGRHGGIKVELPFARARSPLLRGVREPWTSSEQILTEFQERQHWYDIRLHSEAAVGPEKYVTLADERDRFGDRIAKVQYSLNDFDRETYNYGMELLDRIAEATDAEEIRAASLGSFHSTAHHHGTCCMGTDPDRSVTDSFGKVHGVDNLFVIGASQFVGSASVNPVLTIVALTIRSVDYLIDRVL
ncbi:MAG: GMC family oxidoreductase [Cyanobacteria bacterium SID2]|nr:GMC family oxidoreductase [Cyanobacteria bacterium SID2]MBP0005905.1 GMC family oxidoreductase [Cyanobacteria bacterium SBC]